MQKRFLAGLLCGLILGISGSFAVNHMTNCPSPIMMQPLTVQPQTSPDMPPNAHRREFNGSWYYLIPLSTVTQNTEHAGHSLDIAEKLLFPRTN